MSIENRVGVVAKITAAPGKRADLARELMKAQDHVSTEAGTIHYILNEDATDENVLWMWEMYTDQDALNSHMGAQWFKDWGPSLAPFMGGRPELIFVKPLGGKGC
ncbi:MAG: putative quinol monooxygenase [Actinomycetota bacterium]